MHIDLTVFAWFENVVLMIGWIVSNAAWQTLNTTLIAAVPFIAMIIGQWFQVRREGEDEGNKGLLSLNRIESSLYAMLMIYIFTAIPLLSVQYAPANISQQTYKKCSVRVATGGQAGGTGAGAAIGGKSAQIPLWWAIVHAVSTGVTNTMINALPCNTDYAYIRDQLNLSAIHSISLKDQVRRFHTECFGPARWKFIHQKNSDAAIRNNSQIDWIGSPYFIKTHGYYDNFRARHPVADFPFKPSRDSGRSTRPSAGGYPTCKRWWNAPSIGLRDRLRGQISTSLWRRIADAIPGVENARTTAIKGLLSSAHDTEIGNGGGRVVHGSSGGAWYNPTSWAGDIAGLFGVTKGYLGSQAKQSVLVRAAPMIQYLVMMVIVIATPFVTVFSGYSFKAAGILTFTYFGVTSMTFWLQLSNWLRNNLVDVLYNSPAAIQGWVAGGGNFYDKMILHMVEMVTIIGFPILWLSALGWAGAIVGGGISKALGDGAVDPGNAGKSGGDQATGAASKGIKKG